MKVYTKTGDDGTTSLLGGTRVSKSHIRINAYGEVDELNAHIGLLRDFSINYQRKEILLEVQDRLFTIGSLLALSPDKKNKKIKIPYLLEEDIKALEREIDHLDNALEPMKHFVLPGGSKEVSYCHLARCVCRRAERAVVLLKEEDDSLDILIIQYLNRLSDYLFILSRKLSFELGITEVPWVPRI